MVNNHIFDNGWGGHFKVKLYERRLLDQILLGVSNTAVINSTWYTDQYHQQVLGNLNQHQFDRILLVAMIDAAIPQPKWYEELGIPIYTIGYYPGPGQLDFWALFFSENCHCQPQVEIDLPFMCLNRKPHPHRVELYQRLEKLDLLDRGLVSLGSTRIIPERILDIPRFAPDSDSDQFGIKNDIASLGDPDNWKRCFLNIVTETWFDINHTGFVSEKIYKPIWGERPFLVYAADGAKRWLTDRGFQTFENDFADLVEMDLLDPNNLPEFLEVLSKQSSSYWRQKYIDLLPKIRYNKQRFVEYVQEQKSIAEKGIQCQI